MEFSKYVTDNFNDKSKLIYLIDKVKLANRTFKTVFTDFLTPEEAIILKKICHDEFISVDFLGGKGECERVIGAIYKEEMFGIFPIEVLKISCNSKFEKLSHRDYLGAVLSLGIKREKIGDINVFEDGAEIYVNSDMSSYICNNVIKIKNSGVKISIIDITEAKEKIERFVEKKINISSLRLDCIVSSLINLSRTNAAISIKSGEVKLNYSITYEINTKVKRDDLISIKGFGRFKIEDILGVTKSDRLTLLVKKYM